MRRTGSAGLDVVRDGAAAALRCGVASWRDWLEVSDWQAVIVGGLLTEGLVDALEALLLELPCLS